VLQHHLHVLENKSL